MWSSRIEWTSFVLFGYTYTAFEARTQDPHLDPELKPDKPGNKYHERNRYTMSAVVDQYLRQQLWGFKPEVIDYDLAVAYFLE